MSVIRMDWKPNSMSEAEKGAFVAYDDYAKLEVQNTELLKLVEACVAEIEALIKAYEDVAGTVIPTVGGVLHGRPKLAPSTEGTGGEG